MLKILVTGGSGMLGTELKKYLPSADYIDGRKTVDLSSPESLTYIKDLKHYDVIVHAAAYTSMADNQSIPDQAYYLHSGVINSLQEKCDKLVYISAQGHDYDLVYFKSKLQGEIETLKRSTDLVIRTNIYGNGGLVKWALSQLTQGIEIYGYTDVLFNPLSTTQLSKFILESFNMSGIVNTGTSTIMSKYDFLKIIAIKYNLDHELIKPGTQGTYQNLVVELVDQYREFSLSEGIIEL